MRTDGLTRNVACVYHWRPSLERDYLLRALRTYRRDIGNAPALVNPPYAAHD